MPDPNDGIIVQMTQAQLDAQYTRSVHAFWCPVCSLGNQRPIVSSQIKPYKLWEYECDHCAATGTKSQIENSAYYAANIAPRTCSICGGRIHPAADKMSGSWWMLASHNQVWFCESCSFVGKFLNFADEAECTKSLVIVMDEIDEIPY